MKSMQACCVDSDPEYACKILRTLCASFQNCNESPKPVVDARGSLRPNGEDSELPAVYLVHHTAYPAPPAA